MEAIKTAGSACTCESIKVDELVRQIDEILQDYTREQPELIPILQKVQQKYGYLPEEALKRIAKYLNLPECSVFGVATFYAQFKLVPTGKNVVRVCRGTACHVRGGARVLKEVEKRLGIKQGENTSDMEYALETVACIGACALSPTMTINEKTFGQMNTKKVGEIFKNTVNASEDSKNGQS